MLAHRESHGFEPFDGADYRDAVGPTVHFATTPGQLDPWAPKISETHTAFYKEVGAAKLDNAARIRSHDTLVRRLAEDAGRGPGPAVHPQARP